MAASDNMALVQRLFEEVWNRGEEDVLDELLISPSHETSGPQDTTQLRLTLRMLRAALPDWQVTVEEIVAMPDRVFTRWHATGTHGGPFMSLAPTGRRVTATGVSMFHIARGRIQDARVQRDSASMFQQVCTALTSEPLAQAASGARGRRVALLASTRPTGEDLMPPLLNHLLAGVGASNPANAPMAAAPNAVRTSGI